MQEVTIKELWGMVKKRLWLILAFCILVTVAAGVYYKSQPDVYTAEAKLMVQVVYKINNSDQPYFEPTTMMQLASTVVEMLNTGSVMSEAKLQMKELGDLLQYVSFSIDRINETQMLSLTATSTDGALSTSAAEAVSQALIDSAAMYIGKNTLNIVDPPTLPQSPSGPSRARNTMLALIVSLFLGVGASIAIELLNTTLRSAQEAENALSLPVLASIQNYKKELQRFIQRRQKGDTLFNAVPEATRENAKSLATNLQFTVLSRPPRCLAVTSSMSGEGKSSLILLLAEALSQMGKTVLLVDMDMRNPSIGKYLGMRGRSDLFDYLTETARLEEVICKTQNPSVFFVDSRHRLAVAHQMAAYERFDLFLSSAQQMFDVVLFDTPPLGLFVDAAVLANKMDGALLVVGSGMTDRAVVRDMAGQLHKANANILGVVVNFVDERRNRKHYYGKYYGRYAAEERAQSRKEQPPVSKKTAEEV